MANLEDNLAVMAELGAIWYEIATSGDGHKDRDCHFNIDCSFSYGEAARFTPVHFGYVDDGFGHYNPAKGAASQVAFSSFDKALDFCIRQTLLQLGRHVDEMSQNQIDRTKVAKAAWLEFSSREVRCAD